MSGAPLDALVVFGCRVIDGRPSPALVRRLVRAAAAAGEYPAAVLVLSGGDAHGVAEAEVMRDDLVARGVAPARLRCERQARSTAENAARVVPILAELGARRIGLVTDPYHVRRSAVLLRAAARRAGLGGLTVVPLPAVESKSTLARLGLWIEESVKLAVSLVRGPPTTSA